MGLRELDGGRKRKDIVADKEFEIFDDTYVYGSRGTGGDRRRAAILATTPGYIQEARHRGSGRSMNRNLRRNSRPFLRRPLQREVAQYTRGKPHGFACNLAECRRNAGAKSDPLSPGDKSKIWHQKDSSAKDESGRKRAQNSIDAKMCITHIGPPENNDNTNNIFYFLHRHFLLLLKIRDESRLVSIPKFLFQPPRRI